MHPAFLYLPDRRLSVTELSAARIDGDLVELGEGYIPADLVDDPVLRAQSVADLIPAGTAASGPTAAWIHGARLDPPVRHHIRRTSPQRLRIDHQQRVTYHDRRAAASDVQMLGSVLVTSVIATLHDLLLGIDRDVRLHEWAHLLAAVHPHAVDAAALRIAQTARVPGRRTALRTLAELR